MLCASVRPFILSGYDIRLFSIPRSLSSSSTADVRAVMSFFFRKL